MAKIEEYKVSTPFFPTEKPKPSIEEWEKYRVFIIPADMPCDGAEILLYYGSKVAPNINRIVAQEFNMKEYISTLSQSRQEVIEEEYQRCLNVLDFDHSKCKTRKETCIGYQNAYSDLRNNPPIN